MCRMWRQPDLQTQAKKNQPSQLQYKYAPQNAGTVDDAQTKYPQLLGILAQNLEYTYRNLPNFAFDFWHSCRDRQQRKLLCDSCFLHYLEVEARGLVRRYLELTLITSVNTLATQVVQFVSQTQTTSIAASTGKLTTKQSGMSLGLLFIGTP